MAGKTPKYRRIAVNIPIGTSRRFKQEDIGSQSAVLITKGVTEQNPFFTFGENADAFQLNTTTGVFIQWDDEFDELTIAVPATAAGPAVGDIILFNSCKVLFQSV